MVHVLRKFPTKNYENVEIFENWAIIKTSKYVDVFEKWEFSETSKIHELFGNSETYKF